MSATLLYHAFSIRGFDYRCTAHVEGATGFFIELPREKYRCSECGSAAVHSQGSKVRRFQSLPIGSRPTFVFLDIPRVICLHCEHTRQVKISFADPRRTYTHAFERYVVELSQFMTIQHVANHLNVSWDLVKDIQKRNLSRKYGKPKLKNLKEIAIDEICVGTGRYLTLVLDLVSGAVVFVGEGKDAAALTAFWKRLRGSGAKVKAVATDMSKAYIAAVRKNLPKAVHVFDHFHVIKLYNEKLSDFRRELYRELTEVNFRKILKGTRWLLLKNPDNLDEGKNEEQRLRDALDLNTPLTLAYYMKEDLRQIWRQGGKASAKRLLDDWIARARASKVKMLVKFADTLKNHYQGILAYYDYRISTGPMEGTNNKIKTMNRQAYGFRDPEFFKLKIMAIHRAQYALVG